MKVGRSGDDSRVGVNRTGGRVVSQFELLIATFAAPHKLGSDVMSMIGRY
jgi:hypothetical protein